MNFFVKRTLCLLTVGLLASSLLTGCAGSKGAASDPYTVNGFYFNTVISIQVYDSDKKEAADACLALCSKYENLFSRTIEGSDVSKINEANGAPVTVSNETIDIIKEALEYSALTDGKFDITIAPVTTLWNVDGDNPSVPDEASITDALSKVDYKAVQVDGNTVTLTKPGMAIDLGGIAKGYIADRLKESLTDAGVQSALINLGGNVVTIGSRPDNSAFTIGIQKPFAEEGTALLSLKADDWSVVSSGPYERYFEQDGKIYHHIMDTETGWPVENDLYGVTILTKESAAGDALSTGCYALGLEKGMELINSLPDTYAVFITNDYQLHYSNGMEELFKPKKQS